jgi:uncharacterized membrane protein YhfC
MRIFTLLAAILLFLLKNIGASLYQQLITTLPVFQPRSF